MNISELADWDSFCVIVGSAAGALVGLQFVVMTLIARQQRRPSADIGAAFATPTIVHFSVTLFLAAILRAPWRSVTPAAVIWGLIGLGGIIYSAFVGHRMRKQNLYEPESEDWVFYCLLPMISYATLAGSALAAHFYTHEAMFGVAGVMLLLLFIGIHNAWDNVTYNVFHQKKRDEKNKEVTNEKQE